jgi:hypothetical protein
MGPGQYSQLRWRYEKFQRYFKSVFAYYPSYPSIASNATRTQFCIDTATGPIQKTLTPTTIIWTLLMTISKLSVQQLISQQRTPSSIRMSTCIDLISLIRYLASRNGSERPTQASSGTFLACRCTRVAATRFLRDFSRANSSDTGQTVPNSTIPTSRLDRHA